MAAIGARCQPQPFAVGAAPPVHIAWCLAFYLPGGVTLSLLTGWTLCGLAITGDGWDAVQLAGLPAPDLFCAACVHAAQVEPRWRAKGWG